MKYSLKSFFLHFTAVKSRMSNSKTLQVIGYLVGLVLLGFCIKEFVTIVKKTLGKDSFKAIKEIGFETLQAPTITLCPGPGWKSPGPFLTQEDFEKNTFAWEEVFHPKTLQILRNDSLFQLEETFAYYYGICFTMKKLTPEKVSDYSFQFVLNKSIGIIKCFLNFLFKKLFF